MTRAERLRRLRIAKALRKLWRNRARRDRLARLMRRQWRDPRYRRRQVARMKGWHATPTTRRRMSLAFKRRWRDPAHRKKLIRALTKAWRGPVAIRRRRVAIARHNFRPSRGARRLHRLLGEGWFIEFYTPHGPIDIANPAERIAIEVDGIDHQKPAQRRHDRKKDGALRRRGWTVYRLCEYKCRALPTRKGA